MKYLLSLNSGGLKYSQSVYFVADWLVQLDKATLDVENISRGPQIPYVRNKRRLVTKAFMINLYILRGLKNILIYIKETFTELSYRIWFRHACSCLPWDTTLLIVHCFTSLTIETITPWNVFILLYFNVNNIGMRERPWKRPLEVCSKFDIWILSGSSISQSYWLVLYKSIERKRRYHLKLSGHNFFFTISFSMNALLFNVEKLEYWANHNGSIGDCWNAWYHTNPVGNWRFKVVKILDEITYCLKATLKAILITQR